MTKQYVVVRYLKYDKVHIVPENNVVVDGYYTAVSIINGMLTQAGKQEIEKPRFECPLTIELESELIELWIVEREIQAA